MIIKSFWGNSKQTNLIFKADICSYVSWNVLVLVRKNQFLFLSRINTYNFILKSLNETHVKTITKKYVGYVLIVELI